MRDVVLVLGAGASFGARPQGQRPPIGSKLAQYLLDWYDANSEDAGGPEWSNSMYTPSEWRAPGRHIYTKFPDIRPTLVEATSLAHQRLTSFEAVMEKLMVGPPRLQTDEDLTPAEINAIADDSRRLGLVNEVLCFAFMTGKECAFGERGDLYDELFGRLSGTLRAIITPNYDLLAEEALFRLGLRYRYRAIEAPEADAIVIDKFHGSSNFFHTPGQGTGSSLAFAEANTVPTDAVMQKYGLSLYNKLGVHVARDRKQAVCELKSQHSKPVLVTFGPGKDATYERPTLNKIRNECADELRERAPRHIIALGISPPRSDGDDDAWESLCKQLGSLGCKKDYWSGDEAEREKMRGLGFAPRSGYFAELLQDL
jgi:hypothetical protein